MFFLRPCGQHRVLTTQLIKHMRLINTAPGEYYHICNRGVNKQSLFHDRGDYIRFLFLILYFQSTFKIHHINRIVKDFVRTLGQHSVLAIESDVAKKRIVEVVAFCIMPNHFHLVLKETQENGIASYMQRILNAYAKYYNTKYQKSGHVFQGPYRIIHINDNEQLLYLSTYVHRNPREIPKWLGREDEYEWSSYQDFVIENRWRDLLLPDIVLGQFKSKEKYREFSNSSPAKVAQNELKSLIAL